MAYYGNLALRPERAPEERERIKQPIQRQKQSSTVIRSRSIPMGEKLLYLFTLAIVVIIAGFVIFRYTQIYQINSQIQSTNKTYESTLDQVNELQREIERLSDPKLIKEKAMGMGMVPNSVGITVTSKNDQNAVAKKPVG